MTYEEVRQTYSCALPTEQELKDFFANLNMHLAVEDHVGMSGGRQKNLVLYFKPFRGKYLNYIRCFNSFHKKRYSDGFSDCKPHFQAQFPIYVILVSDRLNRNVDTPLKLNENTNWSIGYVNEFMWRIRRNNRNITDSIYPMKYVNPGKWSQGGVTMLQHYWPYYILLSETDARRGFCILKWNLGSTIKSSTCCIPKNTLKVSNFLYALMELSLDKQSRNKIFAKSDNKISEGLELVTREDWYANQEEV